MSWLLSYWMDSITRTGKFVSLATNPRLLMVKFSLLLSHWQSLTAHLLWVIAFELSFPAINVFLILYKLHSSCTIDRAKIFQVNLKYYVLIFKLQMNIYKKNLILINIQLFPNVISIFIFQKKVSMWHLCSK